MGNKGILDELVDKIFSMNKEKILLLALFAFALVLRIIAASNLSISADDMHHVTHAINFFSADRLEVYDQSSGLWHAFTSIIYTMFGTTQIASRTASIIFGSFSIIAIYLLSREFFDEKISLIAGLLLAISPFHIESTMAEMDVMAMFFVLMGMMLFVRSLKTDRSGLFALSGVFLGLSIYTKVYPLLFIPSLLIYATYTIKKNNENVFTNRRIKQAFIFLLCVFIFSVPALTHNYLLYKDKGFLDLQFTRTFDIGKDISEKYYGWDVQFNAKNDWKGLIFGNSMHSASKWPSILTAINFIRMSDPVVFYLAMLSIILMFTVWRGKYNNYALFSFLGIVFLFPFLASIILLPKHFIFADLLIIPLAALPVAGLFDKISANMSKIAIGLIIIISLILLGMPVISSMFQPNITHFYGKSAVAQLMEYKEDKIPANSLIVSDSRIYRGQMNWALQGRPYLEANDLISFIEQQSKLKGKVKSTEIYFVECVPDDCGWGTIKNQPELNKTMESLINLFKNSGEPVRKIYAPAEEKSYYPILSSENKQQIFNVYRGSMNLNELIIPLASQPKQWFLYDIGYEPKEKQFDYYTAHTNTDKLLDKIAHLIVLIALILAFIAPLYSIYLLIKS